MVASLYNYVCPSLCHNIVPRERKTTLLEIALSKLSYYFRVYNVTILIYLKTY